MVGIPISGKESSGTPVFKIIVRALVYTANVKQLSVGFGNESLLD